MASYEALTHQCPALKPEARCFFMILLLYCMLLLQPDDADSIPPVNIEKYCLIERDIVQAGTLSIYTYLPQRPQNNGFCLQTGGMASS